VLIGTEADMGLLINPNVAYLLVVTAVMLMLLTFMHPKSNWLRIWMVICLVAAGYELVHLKGNPWAFAVVALSPLPLFIAIRQERVNSPLFLLTILMLTLGSVYLFVDQNNRPVVGIAGLVSIICAAIIHLLTEDMRNAEGTRLNNDPNSVVGLIGEVKTDIEPHSAGAVLVEGEIWQARSRETICAGSTVRVLRKDGFWLTVKEVEKLTKK
jgi:membrane-bound serine protease (ClpP class)